MKVVNMGNIADAFKFDDLPATGIVIEATPKELKLLPNLAYKDITISEHVSNAAKMREALENMIHDCDGRICKYCGVSGFNRRYPGDYGRAFYIYPNGDEVCNECESRIECGLDPLAWRGESKEGGAK